MNRVVGFLMYAPVVPIAIAWVSLLRVRSDGLLGWRRRVVFAGLCVLSFSFVLIQLEIIHHGTIGRDYSNLRYSVILVNLALAPVAGIGAGLLKSRARLPLIIAGTILLLDWFLIAAFSSVV